MTAPRHAAGQDAQSTVLPAIQTDDRPEPRRSRGTRRRTDVLALLGAGAAAIGLALILFRHVTPLTGALGFLAITYTAFIGIYALLVWLDEDGPTVRDRLMTVVMHT